MAISAPDPAGPRAPADPGTADGSPTGGAQLAGDSRHQTRAHILEVALELIADRGFAATSTREISERLGFTKAALYYHFRTKDDLLAALVAPALDDLRRLTAGAAAPGGDATRRALLGGYVALVGRHEKLIRVLSEDPAARHGAPLAAAMPLYGRLVQLLAGTETPDAAQRTRVRAALGGVHAALVRRPADDDPAVVGRAALAAACGALGLAGPGRLRRGRTGTPA